LQQKTTGGADYTFCDVTSAVYTFL